jgi:tetratricopeptide (TPR) repeat protein
MRPLPVAVLSLLLLADPTSVRAQDGSAQGLERACLAMTDDPRRANLDALQPLVEAESGHRASFLKGCRLLAEQKWGAAGAEFEKAVKAEPGVAVFHFWFGRASGEQTARANPFRQAGLARRTKGEFERAIALDSLYVAPREGLLRYYLAAPSFLGGGVARAREEAAVIVKLNPYRGALAYGAVAFASKDTVEFIRVHEGLVEQYPDSAAPWLTLLNVQLERKQWALAWDVLDRFERACPDVASLRYAIGLAASESGEQLDRGEASLRAYLEHEPRLDEPSPAATHWRLGMIAERRGDVVAARQAYGTATSMDPRLRQAKEALARVK